MSGSKVRAVTGWALLLAAVGVFWDAAAVWFGHAAEGEGSLGLIPAYLGVIVGLPGLTVVNWRVGGPVSGLLAGMGTAGTFVFWGSYPSYSTAGGVGALALGVSLLFLPSWARFVAPLWIVAGTLGVDELVAVSRDWGPIEGFTLGGAAFAATGALVLRGLSRDGEVGSPVRSVGLPA